MRASRPASCCSWPGCGREPPGKLSAPPAPFLCRMFLSPWPFLQSTSLPHTGVGPGLLLVPMEGCPMCYSNPSSTPLLPAKAAAPRGDAPRLGLNHSHLLEQSCILAGVSASRAVSKTFPTTVPPRLGTAGAGFGANPAPGSPQTGTTAIHRAAPQRRAFIFVEP